MKKENNEMRGLLTLKMTDRQGQIIHQASYANHIVNDGRLLVAHLFADEVNPTWTRVTHMAVGTNSTAPVDGNDSLNAQRGERKDITNVEYELDTGVVPNRVHTRLTSIFDFLDANGADPLREAGIFNAATGGLMYNRVVFEPVTKTEAFKLTLIWDIMF